MFLCTGCRKTFANRSEVTIGGYKTRKREEYIFYCHPCRRIIYQRYIQSPKGQAYRKRNAEWQKAHRQTAQAKARYAISSRVYGRRLKRPSKCDHGCTGVKIEAHHPDYSKPLEVKWLCKKHHVAEHYPKLAV